MARLSRILLLSRDVEAAVAWYSKLGLRVAHAEIPAYARLDAGSIAIDIQHSDSEASLCTGYSPLIHFQVESGLDMLIPSLLMAGGRLDGAIQHTEVAQIACIRSPDGHMISISEPNEIPDQGYSGHGQLR